MMAWLVQQVRLFFIALQFFTRTPIHNWVGFESAWLQQSSRYFTAVGWLVGSVCALVYLVCALLWPQPVAVVLSTVAGILLTGAFHEDGFADVCDGFGGGMTPERVLEIMKDSRVGAYGAIGICLLLLVKVGALVSTPHADVALFILFAHPLSRLASCSLIWRMQYVRAEGKAKPLAQHMSNGEFTIACSVVLLPMGIALVVCPKLILPIAVGVLLLGVGTWYLARGFLRRIGGYTGDCLGAAQQLAEVMFYLGCIASLPTI
jgi:adenosylcobinamide-GDP ribazoletransferase